MPFYKTNFKYLPSILDYMFLLEPNEFITREPMQGPPQQELIDNTKPLKYSNYFYLNMENYKKYLVTNTYYETMPFMQTPFKCISNGLQQIHKNDDLFALLLLYLYQYNFPRNDSELVYNYFNNLFSVSHISDDPNIEERINQFNNFIDSIIQFSLTKNGTKYPLSQFKTQINNSKTVLAQDYYYGCIYNFLFRNQQLFLYINEDISIELPKINDPMGILCGYYITGAGLPIIDQLINNNYFTNIYTNIGQNNKIISSKGYAINLVDKIFLTELEIKTYIKPFFYLYSISNTQPSSYDIDLGEHTRINEDSFIFNFISQLNSIPLSSYIFSNNRFSNIIFSNNTFMENVFRAALSPLTSLVEKIISKDSSFFVIKPRLPLYLNFIEKFKNKVLDTLKGQMKNLTKQYIDGSAETIPALQLYFYDKVSNIKNDIEQSFKYLLTDKQEIQKKINYYPYAFKEKENFKISQYLFDNNYTLNLFGKISFATGLSNISLSNLAKESFTYFYNNKNVNKTSSNGI